MKQLVYALLLAAPINMSAQWKLTKNKIITGGLITVSGAAKGFNETLMYHYKDFRRAFPDANHQWFNPAISWKNKYKDRDRTKGEAFPFSKSLLVAFTDQYHLNNFIHRGAMGAAIVIKIGEKQKFTYYLIDFLYYTFCYQLGFATTYYPFRF